MGEDKTRSASAIQRVVRGYFSRVSTKSFPSLWLGFMRPRVDHDGRVITTGMWVYDQAYSQLPLPSVEVVHALADQEQRSPQKGGSAAAKQWRMPGLDAPDLNQAPEAAVRSLCASLCASGPYVDDNMSDARGRQLLNHAGWVVISCLKFAAMAQVTCDV